jgi:methyl-accepting chemotaxis protein
MAVERSQGRLGNVGLGARFAIAFALVVSVFAVSGGLVLTAMNGMSAAADGLESRLLVLRYLNLVEADLIMMESAERGVLLLDGDAEQEARFTGAQARLAEHVVKVEDLVRDPDAIVLLATIEERSGEFAAFLGSVIDLQASEGTQVALDLVAQGRGAELSAAAGAAVSDLQARQRVLLEESTAAYDASRARGTLMLALGVGFAAVVAIVAGVLLTRAVTGPVARLTDLARAMETGDLTHHVDVSSRDELGTMASSLEVAVASVRESMVLIRLRARTLSGAAGDLGGLSDRLTVGASSTASKAAESSVAAGEISDRVDSVAAAAEEMQASIAEIARSASRSAEISGDAVALAGTTRTSVAELAGASQQIGDVVSLIETIAEQTNLLALNATIEAARAGDAGRGFAVVADEVKTLAGQTAEATKQITARVRGIQESTTNATEAIGRIGDVIDEIAASVSSIASAVEEQTAVTSEIARNASQAAEASLAITGGVAEVSATAQDASSVAADVAAASDVLNGLSEELLQLVARFRTETSGDPVAATGPATSSHDGPADVAPQRVPAAVG